LLLKNIKDLAPKILVKTYSLFPHGELTSACTENYNAVLALHHLQENADMCVCFDNHMLCNLIQKKLDVFSPTYGDFNYLIGLVMGGVTACMRFPQFWTTDYRKILNNIVPAPHMHFLVPSYAPIMKNINWKAVGPNELTMPMMKAENNMLQTNENGKYIAASLIYRGQNLSPYVIDKTLEAFQDLKRESFIEWTPYQLHTTICRGLQNTCTLTMLANMTNIEGVFGGMIDQFQKMFDKKSYLQWYIDESKGGSMTEEQFTDARDALVNLRELYVQLNNESPLE
jgi:tubulin beta